MDYDEDSPFYRLLQTKYDPAREDEAMTDGDIVREMHASGELKPLVETALAKS